MLWCVKQASACQVMLQEKEGMKVFKPWKKDYPTGALWEFVTELCGPSNKNLNKKFKNS